MCGSLVDLIINQQVVHALQLTAGRYLAFWASLPYKMIPLNPIDCVCGGGRGGGEHKVIIHEMYYTKIILQYIKLT